MFLQSESRVTESQIDLLENKIDALERQVYWLRQQASKKHDDHKSDNYTLHHLAKAFNRAEKRDIALRSCMQEQLDEIDNRVREFSQRIGAQSGHKDKKSKNEPHYLWHIIVRLCFLPLNMSLWIIRHTFWFLPAHSTDRIREKDELSSFVPYNTAESCYSSEGNVAAF